MLSLDADERLTPELVATIRQLDLTTTPHDAFAMRRRNYIGSRWIKRCGWYPDYCTRLYNRQKTRFKDVKQHSFVEAQNVAKLPSDLIHYSFQNLGELFAKPGRNFKLSLGEDHVSEGETGPRPLPRPCMASMPSCANISSNWACWPESTA